MDEEELRNKRNDITNVMAKFDLETVKIVTMQAQLLQMNEKFVAIEAELAALKAENATLKAEVALLRKENATFKVENATLKAEVAILKGKNTAFESDVVALKEKNTFLKAEIATLQKQNAILNNLFKNSRVREDADGSKKANQPKVGQCSDLAVGKDDELAGTKKEDITAGDAGKEVAAAVPGSRNVSGIGKVPKGQKKREQAEIFRNWKKTMTNRKTDPDLWASGLLKFTVESWEGDGNYMNEAQMLDFIKRNVEQITSFTSTKESGKRFFLTVNKMCSLRNVSKQKFQEIMMCFLNHGPRNNRITEKEIQEFSAIYKEDT